MSYFQANKNDGNLLISRHGKMEFGFSLNRDPPKADESPPHGTGGQVRLAINGLSELGFDIIKHIILNCFICNVQANHNFFKNLFRPATLKVFK